MVDGWGGVGRGVLGVCVSVCVCVVVVVVVGGGGGGGGGAGTVTATWSVIRLLHAPTHTTSSRCLMLHRTVHVSGICMEIPTEIV